MSKPSRRAPSREASAREVAAVRAAQAACDEALDAMSSELRAQRDQLVSQLTEARTGSVRVNYAIGQRLLEVASSPDRYGRDAVPLLLRTFPSDRRLLRKLRQFAETIPADELESLLAVGRDAANGWAMHWGHVQVLLTLSTAPQRMAMATRAASRLLDPSGLAAAVRYQYGRRSASAHGRHHEMPPNVHLQIKQVHDTTVTWLAKAREVWEPHVLPGVLTVAAPTFEPLDLERLQQLTVALQEQVRVAQALRTQVVAAAQYVERSLAAQRATQLAEEQAAESQQAAVPVGRGERSIDLTSRPRRTAAVAG